MFRTRFVAFLAALFGFGALFAAPAFAGDDDMRAMVADLVQQELSSQGGIQARWSSGLRFESADKKFKVKMGGRIQLDHWWIDDENVNAIGQNFDDGVEARRIRLYNAGLIYGNVEYKLQVDFADPENPVFRDLYIGLTNLDDCYGCLMPSIRVGQFKAPMGLEKLTSSNDITFMERAAVSETFAPGRQYGLMFHDRLFGDQLTWALGWFATDLDTGDEPFDEDGDLNFGDGHCFVGRLTWTPWYDCDCACRRLHLGVGIAYCDLGNGRNQAGGPANGRQVQFRSRPYTHDTSTYFADTGVFIAQDYTLFNVELAFVYGPWSLQAEYFIADVSSTAAGDPSFSGWYVQGSYWLTGECRNYGGGVFGRVKPCCNFLDNECCCWGAWELAVRYDYIDLEDGTVTGGEQGTLVVGVNWHLNPNTRVMLNYFNVSVDGGPLQGNNADNNVDLSGFGIRLQVDW